MNRNERYYGMSLKDIEEQRKEAHKDAERRYYLSHRERLLAYQNAYNRARKSKTSNGAVLEPTTTFIPQRW